VQLFSKNRLLVLCLGAVVVFFAQSMFCFADQAGFLPCCGAEQSEHHDATHPDETPSSNCCQNPNASTFVEVLEPLAIRTFTVRVVYPVDDIAPEGSVRTIDYPPQLS
jgi:hypothetical protein